MKKLLKTLLLPTLAAGALIGCASEEDTIIMAPVPQVSSEFTPDSEWSTKIGEGVGHYFSKLVPEYAYDKIFVASRDGKVEALDPDSGKRLWQQDLQQGDSPERLAGGILAAYSKLFIGSENGQMIALDAESGELLWRVDVDGEVLAKPAADANLVIVHTSRGILLALDSETGEQKWTISSDVPNLTLRGVSAPTTTSGGVFWGTANGRLSAAIVERGQLIWQQPIGSPQGSTEIDRLVDVDAAPVLIGSNMYIVGINGQLTAIDLRSGNPAWKRKYSSATDLVTDGRRLYLVTDKDHLVAVDARSGTELWTNEQLEHRLLTAPAIVKGYLVVGDSEGYLHWLSRSSGEFVAQQKVDDSGFAVPPLALPDGYLTITRSGLVNKLTIDQ
ncbi:outer membrane protein assembly factor BamB [Vibrio sp.]|uniref:outer membrane protein assembly factor BamB n=1 Tax=Vibrio sp. TaxID=678 RepID=UPI003D0A472E